MLVSDQYHAWYNKTVSLVQHIISGPVRVISGITFASGSLLRSYSLEYRSEFQTIANDIFKNSLNRDLIEFMWPWGQNKYQVTASTRKQKVEKGGLGLRATSHSCVKRERPLIMTYSLYSENIMHNHFYLKHVRREEQRCSS